MVEISICILTYFHEKYISQTLDSVFSQNITVPFEIIVSDDCSKDDTILIVKEYQSKHPGLIRILEAEHNQGIPANLYKALSAATGKYITILDGDDYYIDESKTMAQYNFLESTSLNNVVGVSSLLIYSKKNKKLSTPLKRFYNQRITIDVFLAGYDFPTNGLMFKNFFLTNEGKSHFEIMIKCSKTIDDLSFCILLLLLGDIFVLPVEGVNYRNINVSGEHNFRSANSLFSSLKKHIELLNAFHMLLPDVRLNNRYLKLCAKNYLKSIALRRTNEFNSIFSTIPLEYRRYLKIKILFGFWLFKIRGIL